MPSYGYDRSKWEAQTAKLLSDAKRNPPVQIPWTAKEDTVLLRLLGIFKDDLQEWQMKMAGMFASECAASGFSPPTKREYLQIVQRLWVLKQKKQQSRTATPQSSERDAPGLPQSKLSAQQAATVPSSTGRSAGTSRQAREANESESDEEEIVEVVKVKKKKHLKVVEVEEDGEEEGAEGAEASGEAVAEEAVQPEESQQQSAVVDTTQSAHSDDPCSSNKRESTLLVEAGGKRMRIGIPPKGTKVACFPQQGLAKFEF